MNQYYSPLRYPGGKAKLASFIENIIEINKLNDCEYIELYAGGAAVGLHLLFHDVVRNIHINDIDYHIYAFWYSVLNHNNQLCDMIDNTNISLDIWQYQREIYNNPTLYSIVDVAFSAFYLNRTNRSGILKAGIIGGKSQNGNWRMDARFNREDLIRRIEKIGRFRDRIEVYNWDSVGLFNELITLLDEKSFYYLDPPYYVKGKALYTDYYTHEDHVRISETLKSNNNQNWLLSYDDNECILGMYANQKHLVYSLAYHAGAHKVGNEILLISNKLRFDLCSVY